MGHSAGTRRGIFCAARKKKCKDGQSYRDNCKKPWKYQAHHVLCVASVTQYLAIKSLIQTVVKQTKWCINTKENMLAMPLWGTLTKYYTARLKLADFDDEPDFAGIPIHTYDHNSPDGYKQEIDTGVENVANFAMTSTEAHKDVSKKLLAKLNKLRNDTKTELQRRGTRQDGTHVEWMRGYGGKPSKKWYEPFSMAPDGSEEPREFPSVRKSTAEKVMKLVKNLI